MRRSFAAAIPLLLLFSTPTHSAPRADDMGPIVEQGKSVTHRIKRAASKYVPRQSGMVTIPCGRGKITIANSGSTQWAGFCKDFAAIYSFKWVNGFRAGKCWTGGKHSCGGAVDFDQSCRSRGPGHCLPVSFPVAASERLADKWGLWPGSRWGHRDVGHFEIRGGLASNGWKPKMEVAALPPEPAPKRWPVALSEVSKPVSAPMGLIVPEEQERSVRLVHLASYGMTWATDTVVDLDAIKPEKNPESIQLDLSAWKPRPLTIQVAKPNRFPNWSPLDAVRNAAWLFGVPFAMMHSIVKIESDYDPNNKTGRYKGLCQMGDTEFSIHGSGNIWNARDNALACARMMAVHAARFEAATGRKATYSDVYCIHQQGWEGCAEHMKRPDRTAWRSMCATEDGHQNGEKWCRKAIWGNMLPEWKRESGSVENVTSGYFVAKWSARVNNFAAVKIEQATGLPILIPPQAVKAKPANKRHSKRHRYASLQ